VKVQWSRTLSAALEADAWGDPLKAGEEYEKLAKSIETVSSELRMSSDERTTLAKIRQALVERCEGLEDSSKGIKLEDAKKLTGVLEALFESTVSNFPVNLNSPVSPVHETKRKDSTTVQVEDDKTDKSESKSEGGTLLPAPTKVQSGQSTFSILIDKIGLKDAQTYIAAHISVVIADSKGSVLERQDTPNSNKLKPNYVLFGQSVHIQIPLEEMAKGHSVFFEFRHYKPKKKKVSVRCFTLMEYDEILKAKNEGGAICLELYQKPTDFTKKNLKLFTVKKLYLHCSLSFVKH
jgi:hypothetical protein